MVNIDKMLYLLVLWAIASISIINATAYIDNYVNNDENTSINYIVYENRHTLNFPQLIAELERGNSNPLISHFMFTQTREGITLIRSLGGSSSINTRERDSIALNLPGRNPAYIEELNPDYYLEEFLKSIALNTSSPEELASSISSSELKDRIYILIQLLSNNTTKTGEVYNEIVYTKNLAEYLYATGEIDVTEYLITMKILRELAEESNLRPLYRSIEESIAKVLAEILTEAGREEALRRLLKSPIETTYSAATVPDGKFRFRDLLSFINRFARSNYPETGLSGNFTLWIPLLNTRTFQFLGYAALASILLVTISVAMLTLPVVSTKTKPGRLSKKISASMLQPSKSVTARSSTVVKLYWETVNILSKNVARKYEWETHREYLYKIRSVLRERSSKLVEEFEKLTTMYERIRFGNQPQRKVEEEAKRSYDLISSLLTQRT